jgi:hypothetical protein
MPMLASGIGIMSQIKQAATKVVPLVRNGAKQSNYISHLRDKIL